MRLNPLAPLTIALLAPRSALADPTTAACTAYVSASDNWQYAIESAAPYSKICLNPGVYTVTSPVRVPTEVSVFGAIASAPTHYPTTFPVYGATAAVSDVVIAAQANFSGAVFLTHWSGANSAGKTSGANAGNYFSGMTITSNPARPFAASNLTGIALENCSGCAVLNVSFTHLSRFGVGAYTSDGQTNNITVSHNTFSDIGQDVSPRNAIPSIYISGANAQSDGAETGHAWVSHNLVTGRDGTPTYTVNADGGVALYNSRNLSVWDNNLNHVGFYLAGQVQNKSGQWVDHGCRNAAFWGNVLLDTQEWAFDIVQGSSLVTIVGNTVSNAGFGAAVLHNVSDVKLRGNTLSGNRWGYVGCGAATIDGTSHVTGSLVTVTGNMVSNGPQACNSAGTPIVTPSLIVTPTMIALPPGQDGSISFTWNVPSQAQVGIWVSVDGGAPVNNAAGGSSGSGGATWITAGHTYKFMAYPHGPTPTTLLAYDTVVARTQ